MVSYSTFNHQWTKSIYPLKVPRSKDYKVYVGGNEVPVYTCRISKYPFNTWWPNHQRQIDQTEIVSFVNIVADEEFVMEVEPLTKTAYERIMVKPYSKGVTCTKRGDRIVFTLKENSTYAFELDDYHSLLYIFNNKPVSCPNPEDVTYYFGAGVYYPGKITLKSNESVYVDKDAYVYGSIFAEDAENIKIYGNGIFDDSGEERFYQHCYEPYTNGNVKFYDCKNVKIQGVGFTNSAIWCVNLFHCFDVEIDGINVFGQWRYNTDGIDIVNSKRIVVKNSFVHSFDDTIVVKGIDRYCNEDNTDMLFENCVLWCDWGKALEIGLETNCVEYKNITFRNIDVLRGGNTTCDIQNGDCAYVHDIVFENIRIELERFHTKHRVQQSDADVYDLQNTIETSFVFQVGNLRFRKGYEFLGADKGSPYPVDVNSSRFASVSDITVKDVEIYCDPKVLDTMPLNEIVVLIENNSIETSEYSNFNIENIKINGKKLTREDMGIFEVGKVEKLKIS